MKTMKRHIQLNEIMKTIEDIKVEFDKEMETHTQ